MSKLILRYKDFGTSEMGYPYSEDEVWWEKEIHLNDILSVLDELDNYIRHEFGIDWFNDTLEEKSEKSYTLNHLYTEQISFDGTVISSHPVLRDKFIFNRELIEVL